MPAASTDKFIKGSRKLAGTIDSSGISDAVVDNFGLSSVAGLPADTAVEITVDRVDSNGAKTPAKEETIRGVVSGSRIVSAVRGVEGTAQSHAAGAVWEVRLTASMWNRMIDGILTFATQTGKLILSAMDGSRYAADAGGDDTYSVTLDPVPAAYYAGMEVNFKPTTANTGACTLDVNGLGAKSIKKNVSSDLSDGDIKSGQIVKVIYDGTNFQMIGVTDETSVITNYGMARQAIINGNFDIWQRGTSVATPDVTITYQADRWYDTLDKNGGTLPTLTRSRQSHTPGDIPNAAYFTRLATNGSGTSLGVSSYHAMVQKIEHGTSKLCGAGKKVTISFWARSSIANKRICPTIQQSYGTGGSPTATEKILGTPITITSSWTKYTVTFTTNTLVGKTFGTNNDDSLILVLWHMWGTTVGNTDVSASVTAETYIGSGNIDISQVQLCAGDVALPFQPKSLRDELTDCQRFAFDVTGGSTAANIALVPMVAISTTVADGLIQTPVPMRIAPTLETLTASNFSFGYPGAIALTALSIQIATPRNVLMTGTVAAGLTLGLGVHLYRPGTSATIILTAEL